MRWRVLLAAVILFLMGCSQATTPNRIHSNRTPVTAVVPRGQPLAVELSQLQRAPEAYEGTLIRVTGEYRRAPIIICDGIARVAPATWRLGQGDVLIGARGFENLVQTLLPPGLTVTVDGVWRFWRGPVGCGKDAPLQSIWYLAVTNIVSPSPVARVTLTPPGGAPAATPDDSGESPVTTTTPAATETLETPPGSPSTTGATTSTLEPATPAATQTSSATATAERDGEEESTLEPPMTAQATVSGTITATATVANGATATATATLSPSATPGGSVVDKDEIAYQALRGSRLNSNETNSWRFTVEAGDVITISVAARPGTDITVTVLDPAENRILEQNDSPAGQIETVSGLEAEDSGEYRVLIAEAAANETYYSLLLLNNNYFEYYEFIFSGLLSYGNSVSSNMEANTDQFWFFFGQAGQVVTINVAPRDQSNLIIDFHGPEGDLLEEGIDTAGQGGAEQLLNIRLPATGMFAIRIGEIEYEAANYTILVSQN